MLGWAVSFLVAAITVAVLGVLESSTTLAEMAKVLFWVFILGMVVSLLVHVNRSRA
jgi:uncharacterized membrane protein YtjA (UPF0391 family)